MSVLYPTEYLLTPSPATALRIGLTLGEGWEDRGGEGKVVRKIEGEMMMIMMEFIGTLKK